MKASNATQLPEAILSKENKKVLVVDDNVDCVFLISQVLEKYGYSVKSYNKGISYQKILKEHPDVVMLDINLTEADGRDICNQLKEHKTGKNIPVILYSGEPIDEFKENVKACDPDCLMLKPFSVKELTHNINLLIREHHQNIKK